MARSSGGGPRSQRGVDDPIYLTAAGRRRLAARLAADLAARQQSAPGDPNDVRDTADEADRLVAADELGQIDDRIAATRAILDRALPMPTGPDDGVVRLGATVRLRDERGETYDLTLVDPVELEGAADAVAVDAPLGAALVGHHAGERVAITTPDGARSFEIVGVEAYRPDQ